MQEEDNSFEGFFPRMRIRDGERPVWVAVDPTRNIELAPVFDSESTCEEVGRKCYDAEQFFDKIPCVPLDTPVPRPQGVFWKAHKRGPMDLTPPKVSSRLARERRTRPQ